MTTTKRNRAPSATDAAVAVPPSLPADREANGKHLAVKKKDRRDSNGNGEANVVAKGAAKEPPPPAGTEATLSSPPLSTPAASSSSAPFWAAVERDALAALVAPEPVERFLSETWERRPAVFRATEERRALVGERGELFTKQAFDAVVAASNAAAAGARKGAAAAAAAAGAEGDEPSPPPLSPPPPPPPPPPALLFGRDVCASRYRRGARENLGGDFGAPVTAAALRRLYGGESEREEEDEGKDDSSSSPPSSSRPPPPSLKATLQVHQPQRWCDASWRLVAALEARLGCLVGANSYLTPADSRGLAPHWDDVEVFVLQVEGAKAWKVWGWGKGKEEQGEGGRHRRKGVGAPLASAPSGDLDERSRGEPALEVGLRPGDVLYLPRGTVHAAAADVSVAAAAGDGGEGEEEEEDGGESRKKKKQRRAAKGAGANASSAAAAACASNHLTLSSHQRWSLCDLALAAISAAAAVPPSCDDCDDEKAAEGGWGGLPASLRPGLPPGFLSSAGFERGALAAAGASSAAAAPAPAPPPLATAAALARGLRDLAEALENKSSMSSSLRLLDGAADALSADFFASRLPPHPSQLLLGGAAGRAPRSAADSVAVRGRGLFRLVACEPGAGCGEAGGRRSSEGGGEVNGGGFVRILSCVRNDRAAHLVPPLPSSSSSPSSSPSSSSFSSDDDDESEKEGSSGSGGGGGRGGSKEVRAEDDDEEEESDDEEEESESDEEEDEESSEGDCSTLYPSSYAPALAQLLSSPPERPLEVSRVALPSAEARLGLVYSLWSEGVLAVVEK